MTALLLLAVALARPPQYLEVRFSPDYGPAGNGPSFSLNYSSVGPYRFSCHRWLLPDGQYVLDLSPSDVALVIAAVEDLRATSTDPPEFWHCPHSPDFGVVYLPSPPTYDFVSFVCVSNLRTSRFAFLYELVSRLATLHCVPLRFSPPQPPLEVIDTQAPGVGRR